LFAYTRDNGLAPAVPTDSIGIIQFTPNFANPGSSTVSPANNMPSLPFNLGAGSAPTPGGGTIGTLAGKTMFKTTYRNFGAYESIVMCVTASDAGRAAIKWWELRRNGGAGSWSIFQDGLYSPADALHRFMPAITISSTGSIGLLFNASSSTVQGSLRFTGRNPCDPPGQMTLPEQIVVNGSANNTSGNRYGDYNSLQLDPVTPNSFWGTGQYSTSAFGTFQNWGTRIVNFSLSDGCAPSPSIVADGYTLLTESCVPANGVIDPGETVTVRFCLKNVGTANTINAVASLQATGGVVSPSGPQSYGVLIANGPNGCADFTFTNNSSTCGGTITATFDINDLAIPIGIVSFPITLGTTAVTYTENFDAVVAPALPAGWVATNLAGAAPLWVTSTSGTPAPPVVSAPNAAFVNDPSAISDKVLETSQFTPGFGATLTFQNNWLLENGFDGGVLEISINGGPYVDIITAGGSFLAGGYNGSISNSFGNPLGGRSAWTGSSAGFTTTTVRLPNSAAGQNVKLRFRMGSDSSVAGTGWRIDDLSMSQPVCCGAVCTITCPANVTVNATPGQCGAIVTYPAAVTSGLCGPVTYTNPSGSFFPVGTTTVTASTAAGPSCTFTVTVVDNVPPTIACPAPIVRNNDPGICGAVVTFATPGVTDNCPLPGEINLTQSVARNILPISIGCQSGGLTTPNSWWRAYDLAPLALPAPLTITKVTFGIERVTIASGSVPLTIRVYTSAGPFPASTRTQVASQNFAATSAMTGTIQTVTFATPATVPANSILAVEVSAPDGRAPANFAFFMGSNAGGQTGPSYILAPDCGATVPTNLASLGFPNDHIILDIGGTIPVVPPVISQTGGPASGSVFPVGTTPVTFTARDAAGNTSTCTFNVTVNDNQQPNIACPTSVIRNTDAGQCYATYTPPQPTISDNCAVTKLTWTMTGATSATSPATGINYVPSTQFLLTGTTGVGVTTITYTASDAAGNTRTCTFTVTVNDASIPVITTQPATKFFCVGSNGVFTVVASAGAGNPLTYQWQQWNGSAWVNMSGATAATLTIPNVTFAMNSNSYRCILTGRCSVVITNFATLYVNPLPSVSVSTSIPPILVPGQVLDLISSVSPGGGSYAWFKNGQLLTSPLQQGPVLSGLTVNDIGTYRLVYTDLNGCSNTSADIVVSGQASEKLWVYPVPNNGQFQVRFFNQAGEQATVRVFDAKGAKVYERSIVTNIAYTQIDINLGASIPDGTYIVELVNGAGNRVGAKKIIVRRKP
ncbi:MAG: HYR domain-containing protein, partial [Chitinophagaceae bacterium]